MDNTESTQTNDPITDPSMPAAPVVNEPDRMNSDANDETGSEPETGGGIRSILSTVAILVIAPLIALSLTAFVFQSYEVDGPSMETTLQNHDRLIVYKLPKTVARITGHAFVPNRGDIIIFNRQETATFGPAQSRQLIKRVIALPGERVVVKDEKITVYNSGHPGGFHPDDAPYGKVITTTPGDVDLVVPKDSIYVCGDNRTNSLDSRYFGPVATKDIVGKLALRVFPFGKSKVF